jgi:hypothetical protein
MPVGLSDRSARSKVITGRPLTSLRRRAPAVSTDSHGLRLVLDGVQLILDDGDQPRRFAERARGQGEDVGAEAVRRHSERVCAAGEANDRDGAEGA